MTDVQWSAIIDALIQIEEGPADAVGLLGFGPSSGRGGIFVERGRVCWAAAPGLQKRLTDLLQGMTSLSSTELEALYTRCRDRGEPLGEVLVAERLLAASELEAVLRRHTAESLVSLCETPLPSFWREHRERGYAPRFTCLPLEVLFDVVELVMPAFRAFASDELTALRQPGRRGAAYLLDSNGGAPLPIAEFGHGLSLREVHTLGCWAMAMPAAARELATSPAFSLARTADGDAISVWWRGSLLLAVVCEDHEAVATLTARHLAFA